MSYIPDCRPKYEKDTTYNTVFKKDVDEKEINPYWYGLLVGDDKEFMRGFDYNTMNALCNLFDNLDIYADELEECGIDVDDIDAKVVNGAYGEMYNVNLNAIDERECKYLEEYTEEELAGMSKSTKIMLTIKSILLDYIEMQRDELVTGMIEDMDDDVHAASVEKAKKED